MLVKELPQIPQPVAGVRGAALVGSLFIIHGDRTKPNQ